ncbi:glutathione S-transferase [Magnetococcus marinus MC-1]|uniref:Glutathione S-transferase n=1 Tax=Magnetococcus marinus (strain ATCC BAA-1437 / JCM 17883 / MC-1) TaxID=156889 RepID=A0L6K1_MAGMM|nr:glutathione S-transferase [Magnetococcus marinus]ABK43594.1 glutathione S-transferase [Magnetococcus marinus MC-1]
MMHFYMTPGSCSTGIHILLEELDLLFAAHIVNLPAGEHQTAAYLALNPKGTIPVLVTAHTPPEPPQVLADFTAIAWWLATTHPKAKLLPENPFQQAAVLEVVNHITATVHGQGFTRIFTPEKYHHGENSDAQIQQAGRELVAQGFAILAQRLAAQGPYLFGSFSIADAALFYVTFWADRIGLPMPTACRAHLACMLQRPKVQQVVREEGYSLSPSYAERGCEKLPNVQQSSHIKPIPTTL